MTQASGADARVQVRRPLTAVFIDIVGSTSLSILMDGEEYATLIARYRDIADEVVARHAGFVPKDEGDGRFIWFGWPSARRDDAQRAIAMSLDLQTAVAALSDEVQATTDRPLTLRIGIHTGPAIVTFPAVPTTLMSAAQRSTSPRRCNKPLLRARS